MDIRRKAGSSNLAQYSTKIQDTQHVACLTLPTITKAPHSNSLPVVEAQSREHHRKTEPGNPNGGNTRKFVTETLLGRYHHEASPEPTSIPDIADVAHVLPIESVLTHRIDVSQAAPDSGNMPSHIVAKLHCPLGVHSAASRSYVSLSYRAAAVQQQNDRLHMHRPLRVVNENTEAIISGVSLSSYTGHTQVIEELRAEGEQMRLEDLVKEKKGHPISGKELLPRSVGRIVWDWGQVLKTDIMDIFPNEGLVKHVKKKGAKLVAPRLKKLAEEVEKVADEGKMKVHYKGY